MHGYVEFKILSPCRFDRKDMEEQPMSISSMDSEVLDLYRQVIYGHFINR